MHDLTAFQRDLLRTVAAMDKPKGLEVKSALEEYYGKEINHGRLYPNLDELAEKGLIEKGQHNRRSNFYEETRRGARELEERDQWNDRLRDEASKPTA